MEQPALGDTSLQRLHIFVTVVDRGGYSAAADHLEMAQPSVSYHVHSLERSVGAELVVYRNRSIHLTPEGEQVYRAAQTILNEGERVSETIYRMRGGQVGRLAMGASIAFEHQFFFDLIIAPYTRRHPEIHFSLEFGHSVDLVGAVSTGSIDMAYVNDWQIPPDLEFEHLHDSDLVFLVSPEHGLASKETITPADIDSAGLVASPIDTGEVISYHEMLRSSGVRNPRVTIEIDGIQARKLATQAGLGVLATFAPPYAGEHAMSPLRTLRLEGKTAKIDFGLVSRRDRSWTPLMKDMADWLRSTTAASPAS